jgi:hypothetical protein
MLLVYRWLFDIHTRVMLFLFYPLDVLPPMVLSPNPRVRSQKCFHHSVPIVPSTSTHAFNPLLLTKRCTQIIIQFQYFIIADEARVIVVVGAGGGCFWSMLSVVANVVGVVDSLIVVVVLLLPISHRLCCVTN